MSKSIEFSNAIKNWCSLDDKYKELLKDMNEIRNKKNLLRDNILENSRNLSLDNKILKINNKNIQFIENKFYQPLTFKFLEECLNNCINEKEQINILLNYIKNKREIRVIKDIKSL